MGRISGLAQVADDGVGLDVHEHAGEEQYRSSQEGQAGEPVSGIIADRGDVEDPPSLHDGVEGIEQRAHAHYGPGHTAVPAQLPGEDERAVEIVNLEKQQEDYAH